MKKVGSLVLAVCLLLGCFGCQNQQDALYSAAKEDGPSSSLAKLASPPPSPEEEELTGELTIRHVAGGDNLQYFAKLFQQLHPGVEVKMVPTCLKVRGTSRYTSSTRMALMSTKVRPTSNRR